MKSLLVFNAELLSIESGEFAARRVIFKFGDEAIISSVPKSGTDSGALIMDEVSIVLRIGDVFVIL